MRNGGLYLIFAEHAHVEIFPLPVSEPHTVHTTVAQSQAHDHCDRVNNQYQYCKSDYCLLTITANWLSQLGACAEQRVNDCAILNQ